jgi:hypothetical protein
MSKGATEQYYQLEEMELDELNKMSYLQHISYRLKLPDCLPCEKKNGVLSTDELRVMAEEIIHFERDIDVDDDRILKQFLVDLSVELSEQMKLNFVKRKEWPSLTKKQLGTVIAAVLKFQYLGDPHIGQNNGVVYLEFYKSIYNRLPDPAVSDAVFTSENYNDIRLKSRKHKRMTGPELFAMMKDTTDEGVMIPEYQRSDLQWGNTQRRNMVDSMVRNIPMPSIILGKCADRPGDPWQLIDGNQRMSTVRRYLDDEERLHFDFHGAHYETLPPWAKKYFDEYQFLVEFIVASSDRELADLFTRYNTSGKAMTPVQIRVAKHHEISAAHHLLLAMAGGPVLANREEARVRLGIDQLIGPRSERASALRKLLPKVGEVTPDEKFQLRRVTEKVYDLWCRVIAYSNYRKIDGNATEFPTAQAAINRVFHKNRAGAQALPLVERLDYIIRECNSLYGDFAFLSKIAKVVSDEIDPKTGLPRVIWVPGKSIHGWATQVQCAAIWDLNDDDLSLLKRNPDTFQERWERFVVKEIAAARQNSATIWDKQTMWTHQVRELLDEFKSEQLDDEASPRRLQLLGAVEIALSANSETREMMMDMWKATHSKAEWTWMNEELKTRS